MNKYTRKRGGNITNSSGLQHILSIGYELECANLMKLTKVKSEDVLFNSDTLTEDIDDIQMQKMEENTDDLRSQELVEIDVIDKNGNVDGNTIFNITNDISNYQFTKKLKKVCFLDENEKNDLYIFRDIHTNRDYKINFVFKTDRNCEVHSNVEWIFTYYKPKRSINVVLNTFLNMIENLVMHLEDLTQIRGNFIMKYKDENGEDNELIIDSPAERILYNKPETNLYYLQTQVSSKPFKSIDDTCTQIQMTFSTKIENVYTVVKTMYTNKKMDVSIYFKNFEIVKQCVDELLDTYNETAEYKIISKKQKSLDAIVVKNYLLLFLYKINTYYFYNKQEKKPNYLKNLLYINCRHSNYTLYVNLKKYIQQVLGVDDATSISIIKKIVLQPKILTKMLDLEIREKMRKGVFLISNTLDITHKQYGNPEFSLVSYFDFFENPVQKTPINESFSKSFSKSSVIKSSVIKSSPSESFPSEFFPSESSSPMQNDWLESNNIDIQSTRMPLNNDVILIECRPFNFFITKYLLNNADEELKTQMRTGACNIISNIYSEQDVPGLTVANFKKIIEIFKNKKKYTRKRSL
jgi:hypothetical protein